jgi:hypothetical protein
VAGFFWIESTPELGALSLRMREGGGSDILWVGPRRQDVVRGLEPPARRDQPDVSSFAFEQ